MTAPFLFRFKEICQSPNRSLVDPSYIYDPETDMVIDRLAVPPIAAIESARIPGPPTKKSDVEKGDDDKDRRMWQ